MAQSAYPMVQSAEQTSYSIHNVNRDRGYYQFNKQLTNNAHLHAGSNITTCKMHTHTHTVQTGRGEGQCCLTEIFGEEKCLEFAFEGGESHLLAAQYEPWKKVCLVVLTQNVWELFTAADPWFFPVRHVVSNYWIVFYCSVHQPISTPATWNTTITYN